jgi:hypothetical protein
LEDTAVRNDSRIDTPNGRKTAATRADAVGVGAAALTRAAEILREAAGTEGIGGRDATRLTRIAAFLDSLVNQ